MTTYIMVRTTGKAILASGLQEIQLSNRCFRNLNARQPITKSIKVDKTISNRLICRVKEVSTPFYIALNQEIAVKIAEADLSKIEHKPYYSNDLYAID